MFVNEYVDSCVCISTCELGCMFGGVLITAYMYMHIQADWGFSQVQVKLKD